MRLRQVALAATDLGRTVDTLTDVLGLEVCFRDPAVAVFGLENALMAIGDTFLEVVSPVREDATARRWIAKRGGDAGYMVILQCDDRSAFEREVARAEAAGAKKVWEGDREGACTAHFHPRELGAIASLDAMPAWEDWHWAGPAWREHVRTDTATAIVGAVLESPDPERLAARWSALLGIRSARDAGGRIAIPLPRGGRIAFSPGDGGEGLVGVELALADRDRFIERARARGVLGADGAARIAGTRFGPAPL